MTRKLIEQIHNETGVDRFAISRVMSWLEATQVVSYRFDDPDGFHYEYPSREALIDDLKEWDDGQQIPWAIYQQIEIREPVTFVTFSNGEAKLQ